MKKKESLNYIMSAIVGGDKLDETRENIIIPNTPVIESEMQPIKYDSIAGEWYSTEVTDKQWYNYENKKWAFVSDYVRAYAIYNYGGIYLDTDVFVIDKLDSLLNSRAFVGFEAPEYPFTAVFGAEKEHPLIKDMLDYYTNLELEGNFKDNNTISVSNLLIEKYGCKTGNIEQELPEGIKVYKDDVLCNPSRNSLTVHVFLGSWLNNNTFKNRMREFLRMKLNNKFSIKLYCNYVNLKNELKRFRSKK